MRKLQGRRAAWGALALLAGACTRVPSVSPVPQIRYGPGRDDVAYSERAQEEKKKLLVRLNEERRQHGLRPLAYDLLAAKVGDAFCQDSAAKSYSGHWDLEGRPPYLRWALAGGVDFHAENVSSFSRAGGPITPSEIERLLLTAHGRMMDERPPDDGHRRAILDPVWTHVGFGVGWADGEFRMTEEFSRRVAEWVEIPAGPVRAGRTALFASKLPAGWTAGVIEVAYARTPMPLSREEIRRRGSYGYPKAVALLRPLLSGSYRYPDGSQGQYDAAGGRITANLRLSGGAGHYWVLLYANEGSASGRPMSPVVAALVVAE
jgi:uncharacterized protein YkwD